MLRPRKKRDMGGIPTASMSDVAFLLLIFFLSTTKFDMKYGLGLVLPAPSTEETVKVRLKQDNLTKVMIDKDGRIAINEDIVPFDQVRDIIRKLVKDNPDMVISLKTDRQSNYNNMIIVLDQLRLAGAEKINLSTN
ncbi:MAG TPA: biopolymer transporter ExbD [Candidatus Cloacimonadota bacterium]|jgi:biopolymer transport protein ExbD|nr:biopolymer transporter ExbD [Candidatus Cloacimonadales bacterium]HOE91223.1 biopolymer transporter ExbD [Candidatus Cloacimonadota bacterium]HOQ80327.1 biopolymer transporter ExbD [Candidatus Cloacimonadota bacterium]HPK40842.1 biopolymer transporter ExbD [Candidatus Cloacimonadota bacterium]HPY96437.1 biopolymer transporter ExbD [Candidatus Cloacimonadota bacterium]